MTYLFRTARCFAACNVFKRALTILSLTAALSVSISASAETVKVGVLRYVSSGGLFVALEKGYFKQSGLDLELKFFESAQAISMATASGDVDFGVTAYTAGFYNLAGKGALKIIAAQAQEHKGYEGNLVLASKTAYAKGLTSVDKLGGKSIAITQAGSSFHYQVGQIAAAKGFALKSVQFKPMQSLPNMIAALKGSQVDAIILAPHLAKPLLASGEAHQIGRVSDVADYQYGGLFTSTKVLENRLTMVEQFVRAYRQGAGDYVYALVSKDASGKIVYNATTDAVAKAIAKYVYPAEPAPQAIEKVKGSAFYIEPQARIDAEDIANQIKWLKEQGLVDAAVEAKNVLDLRFQPK